MHDFSRARIVRIGLRPAHTRAICLRRWARVPFGEADSSSVRRPLRTVY